MDTGLNRLGADAVKTLQEYAKRILDNHKAANELRYKAELIDIAYYRYSTDADRTAGSESCGVNIDNLTIPIVISQVDSFVGYDAEVYLSGYPTFPVVSTPKTAKLAEKMEGIIDQHATIGGYSRELLKYFRQGIKYNFAPWSAEWMEMPTYGVVSETLNTKDAKKLEASKKGYTCLRSHDLYNTIWDNRFHPAEVMARGDFIGWIDRASRNEVKALYNKLQADKIHYNQDKLADLPANGVISIYYTLPPQISQYVSQSQSSRTGTSPDWDSWFGGNTRNKSLMHSMYELAVVYIRCIPSDFGINVPNPGSPQMFKLWMLNGQIMIGFDRVITPYNLFPMGIGTPLEDQFGLQTPSIGESQAGWQIAASTLFQIRINSARRAISDRGIYDTDLISSTDINSPHAAAKIPARLKGLQDKTVHDAYMPIPFQPQGLEGVIGDMGDIMRFADQTSGLNAPQRGQFQKGNKTVDEWRDTMGSADNRLRLQALNMEFQTFIPIKEAIKFNLFRFGAAGTYTNYQSGEYMEVKPEDLSAMQTQALAFRIADGYTPKSKLASTDFLNTLVQNIISNPALMQMYGAYVPGMIAHLAQLGGVRGLDEYAPPVPQATQQQAAPMEGQQAPMMEGAPNAGPPAV